MLRVDGRGFSRFTETHFEKPFDAAFHEKRVHTARLLLEELQGLYAYKEEHEAWLRALLKASAPGASP